MRLEPVYLVAPPQKPTTRRDFVRGLLCGAVAGGVLGAGLASGLAKWLSVSTEPPQAPAPDDARTLWALALQEGPLDALIRDHETFLWLAESTHDVRLEHGIERLAQAVLEDDADVRDARTLATSLAMTIESMGPEHRLARLAPGLRASARR